MLTKLIGELFMCLFKARYWLNSTPPPPFLYHQKAFFYPSWIKQKPKKKRKKKQTLHAIYIPSFDVLFTTKLNSGYKQNHWTRRFKLLNTIKSLSLEMLIGNGQLQDRLGYLRHILQGLASFFVLYFFVFFSLFLKKI